MWGTQKIFCQKKSTFCLVVKFFLVILHADVHISCTFCNLLSLIYYFFPYTILFPETL